MDQFPSALLQHDIVDQVLSYCSAKFDANPFALNDIGYMPASDWAEPEEQFPTQVPSEAAWLATAARTCKAWLEPALRHLYRTIYLCRVRVPTDTIERIGHRVRTLVININPSNSEESEEPNVPFNHFTDLTTLFVVRSDHRHTCFDSLLSDLIISCPSLPNLSNLILWFPAWPIVPQVLKPCKNLRRFRIVHERFERYLSDSDDGAVVRLGKFKLEELVLEETYVGRALAPLLNAPLVLRHASSSLSLL
jgi:hypothetical protein